MRLVKEISKPRRALPFCSTLSGFPRQQKGSISDHLFLKPPLLIPFSFLEVLWWSSVPYSDRSVHLQKSSGEGKCVFPRSFNFTL